MNEFERLKVAQIASVEVKEHGTVLLKRREAATKVYLLLKGRCSVFDFTDGMDAMWKQREVGNPLASICWGTLPHRSVGEPFRIDLLGDPSASICCASSRGYDGPHRIDLLRLLA